MTENIAIGLVILVVTLCMTTCMHTLAVESTKRHKNAAENNCIYVEGNLICKLEEK